MNTEASIKRVVWSRQHVGVSASVRQRNDLLIHTFVTDHPALVLLRRGRKTIKIGDQRIVLLPGDAVAIAAGSTCDVQNETERGEFLSSWIICDNSILSRFETQFPEHKKLKSVFALKDLGDEFALSFERAIQSIAEPERMPRVVAEHRMQELLAWLAHAGWVFNANIPSDLQSKVRLMIGVAPEKKWMSRDLARTLAMSEATLRRRLADQGQSLTDILIDVRMTTALTLLQVTDLPVGDVAYQVGYDSASRFSVRFKKRFGFSPMAVRGDSSLAQPLE